MPDEFSSAIFDGFPGEYVEMNLKETMDKLKKTSAKTSGKSIKEFLQE